MKILYFLVMTCVIYLITGTVFAQSISYQGFECSSASDTRDSTPSEVPLESRFEVIEILDRGMVRLSLTGGLPRFVNDSQEICIDSDTAIGFEGVPETAGSQGLPLRLDRIDATGYFNGQNLVIVVNSIFTDLSASRGTFSSFTTSRVQPVSNILIFDYNASTVSFILRRTIHNKGFVQTSGSTSTFPFLEIIVPSFDELGSSGIPQILTPPSEIIYRLDN